MFTHRKRHQAPLRAADRTAGVLLTLGAVNWGLVGVANFDPVRAALGRSGAARAVYGLVGASAAYALARGRHIGDGL